MTSACFSRGHTGFSRNATLVATVNPPALAGGVFNFAIGAVGIQERKEEKPGYMMKGVFSADAENIAC